MWHFINYLLGVGYGGWVALALLLFFAVATFCAVVGGTVITARAAARGFTEGYRKGRGTSDPE